MVGFLAIVDQSATVGDNLVAVWHRQVDGAWQTKSWEGGDPWEAIQSVKDHMAIPDSQDNRWLFEGMSAPTGAAAAPPQGYAGGVLESDPLADAVANNPDREEILEFLTSVGYAAANVPVDSDEFCSAQAKLSSIASSVMQHEAVQPSQSTGSGGSNSLTVTPTHFTIIGAAEARELCVLGTIPPINPRPAVPAAPPAPIPSIAPTILPIPGPPPGPGWVLGAWSAWDCKPQGVGGCICTRKRYWGRWERDCWIFGWPCFNYFRQATETEQCSANLVPCPAAGPPPAGAVCTFGPTY